MIPRKSQKKGLSVLSRSAWKLLLILCSSTGTAWARTQVAWVLTDPSLCKTKFCLHGTFKKGLEVMLLSKVNDKVCILKVGDAFKAKYEPGSFDAVELKNDKKCKIEQPFLGVFEQEHAKYKIITGKSVAAEELSKIDRALKKDIFFSRTWRKNIYRPDGNKDRVAYTVADFKRMESEAFTYNVKKDPLLVIQQKFPEGSNPGMFFSQFKGNWSVVSSAFTTGKPFVFTLGKRFYVLSRVTCQKACGYSDFEIYEFNGRKFKLIYNNADLST